MFKSKLKFLTIGASVAMMAATSAPVAAQTLSVAVTRSFVQALGQINSQFANYYFENGTLDYNLSYNWGPSDQAFEASIIAGGSGYDLFISQSSAILNELVSKYPKLVVGSPFPIAIGELELYSGLFKPENISNGLPSNFYTQNIVLPDPDTDAYGNAAWEVLSRQPGIWDAVVNGTLKAAPSVDETFNAIEYGPYSYGFVAKSQICTYSPAMGDVYEAGTYHHQYPGQVVVSAIKLVNSKRTAAQETELNELVAFLTGSGPTQRGVETIQQFCYRIPGQ